MVVQVLISISVLTSLEPGYTGSHTVGFCQMWLFWNAFGFKSSILTSNPNRIKKKPISNPEPHIFIYKVTPTVHKQRVLPWSSYISINPIHIIYWCNTANFSLEWPLDMIKFNNVHFRYVFNKNRILASILYLLGNGSFNTGVSCERWWLLLCVTTRIRNHPTPQKSTKNK